MRWYLLGQCFSALLELLLLSCQTDRAKDLQILLLRRQLAIAQRTLDKPLRPTRHDKFLLALLTAKFKSITNHTVTQLQDMIQIVQPATVLKWHRELIRRKWTYRQRSRDGRPRTDAELEHLVLQLARENDWGNGKITGELLKLGYALSDETVAHILKRHGIPPLPQRRPSLSWRHLMTHYKDQILACDFFTIETLFLQTVYVLFFIELGSRRVHLAGCTTRPSGAWVAQQARQVVWQIEEDDQRIRFLLHDNDSKFTTSFDTVFASEHIKVIRTPYRAPNANEYAERWVRSVRVECLDKLLILNEAHLRRVLRDYIDYYNTARPHQGIDQRTPVPRPGTESRGAIQCRTVLGILNDYYRNHPHPRYPNRIKGLKLKQPNQVWVADITYIRLGRRFIYLAVILDAYTRAVRGWALSRTIDQQLTLDALDMALTHGRPSIFHSGQGSQYVAWLHTDRLLEHRITISMSDKASPTQNGLVERFIRTVKEEHVDYSEYNNFEDAFGQIKHWLEVVYMRERIHQALDYLTPVEFEMAARATARYPLLAPA